MPIRKPVTIHYRRLDDNSLINGLTLESAIRTSMNQSVNGRRLADRYALRIYTNGDDNLFANVYHDAGDLVFGDILHFTKGHLQALFDAGQRDASSASVEQMQAPEQKEYIHSLMYWMVKDDHAFVIQSTSLRTETLEEYLSWLLSTKTKTAAAGSAIVLAGKFDPDAVGGDLSDIEQIIIGGVATPPPSSTDSDDRGESQGRDEGELEQRNTLGTSARAGWKQARDILATLLGGSANVDKMMEAVPNEADLSVEVHIGYKTRKRGVSRQGLKSLETGLRNLPDGQLRVKAKDGIRSTDGSIRLHHSAAILLKEVGEGNDKRPGSLMDPEDVLRAMREAYLIFKSNGKIDAPE